MAAIDYLKQQGLTVEVVGNKLRLRPQGLITESVRQYVLAHKALLLLEAANDPCKQALAWLASVARILDCSPTYLFEHGFVDHYDLLELKGAQSALAASLIRSNPHWSSTTAQEELED